MTRLIARLRRLFYRPDPDVSLLEQRVSAAEVELLTLEEVLNQPGWAQVFARILRRAAARVERLEGRRHRAADLSAVEIVPRFSIVVRRPDGTRRTLNPPARES